METTQTPPKEDAEDVIREAPSNKYSPVRVRARIGGLLLLVAVAATFVVGGWGALVSLSAKELPAGVGEAVEVPRGVLQVDKVTPEHMAPMQMDKFAKKGMNMSGMVADMTPEGQRRLNVDVTLAAKENTSLAYSEKQFRLTGEGMDETGPLRSKLGSGSVPPGSAVSGTLVLQVPEEASKLMLSFDGGRPVALDLKPLKDGEGSSHGGEH